MTPAERRRLTLATIITVIALPALWLVDRDNRSDTGSIAAVGAPAPQAGAAGDEASADTEPPPPAYLEGPSATAGPDDSVVIASASPTAANRITGTAGYRAADQFFSAGACQVPGAPTGTLVTVRNVDNDRTTTCVNATTLPVDDGVALLETNVFLHVADLVDAPLPVEITW